MEQNNPFVQLIFALYYVNLSCPQGLGILEPVICAGPDPREPLSARFLERDFWSTCLTTRIRRKIGLAPIETKCWLGIVNDFSWIKEFLMNPMFAIEFVESKWVFWKWQPLFHPSSRSLPLLPSSQFAEILEYYHFTARSLCFEQWQAYGLQHVANHG